VVPNSEAVNSRAFTNEAEETYARAYAMPRALPAEPVGRRFRQLRQNHLPEKFWC
jgi:hypothetical protein